MKKRILVTTQMMIHDQNRFGKWLQEYDFKVDFLMNDQFLNESDCLQINPVYSGWIAGDDEITNKVIDHLIPSLEIISKWGTGIDSIDTKYAKDAGLLVKNSPGAFGDAVGEIAVAYLLALSRGILKTHFEVLHGAWPKKQYIGLNDMSIGIVGMGAIGQGILNRLHCFGCKTSYFDPNIELQTSQKLGFEDLLTKSDAIIVSCELNPTTFQLFNKDAFNMMKSNALFINVSRGPIVKFNDLVLALKENMIAGAALDVYEEEPLPENKDVLDPLNIILGSHNGNNTRSAVENVHENTILNLVNFFNV